MEVNIVVIGAGEVGAYITRLLTDPKHQTQNMNVSVIDPDTDRIKQLDGVLDATMVKGSGSHPEVLEMAGIDEADLLVAVSSNDEVNLLANLYARNRGVEKSIIRIEADEIKASSKEEPWFLGGEQPDLIFDPDEDTAREISELLDSWGADEIATLGGGQVVVIGVTVTAEADFSGKTLSQIGAEYEPDWSFLVAALRREGEAKIPRSEETLQAGDHIWLVIKRSEKSKVLETLGFKRKKHKRILLLGGGRTGEFLARRLVKMKFREVTLVESDSARAEELAEKLDGVDIRKGDITDAQFISEIDAGKYDAAVALTGKDEANVLSCMYAKSLGTDRTIAILHKLKLMDVLDFADVDSTLSPVTASANRVLRYVHDVKDVATFLGVDQDFEVVELKVGAESRAVEKKVSELKLPRDVLIGALIRNDEPSIVRGSTQLQADDTVLLIAPPEQVDAVRKDYFISESSEL
ncbi:MAG: Trk system potassium transporter TrkA [Acidimicrobiaceae bacterium]|nr:Trk system potassium transporter TrkA [Acidimicrobiaceae bacterium]